MTEPEGEASRPVAGNRDASTSPSPLDGRGHGLDADVCPHEGGGEHRPVSLGRGEGTSGWSTPCCLVGGEGPSGWVSPCSLLRAPRVFRPREHAGTMPSLGSATGKPQPRPAPDRGQCEGTDAAAFGSRVTPSYFFIWLCWAFVQHVGSLVFTEARSMRELVP